MDFTTIPPGELIAILDMTRRMAEQRLVAPLLDYIVETALKLTCAQRGYVVLFGANDTLDFRVTRDHASNHIVDAEDQVSRSVLAQVRANQAPLVLRDALNDADFQRARSVRQLQLRSVMCVPLIAYGTVIGAIYVENRSLQGCFKASDVALLMLFTQQAAIALEHAVYTEQLETQVVARTHALTAANTQLEQQAIQLHQRMAELETLQHQLYLLSIHDSLTGLHNRRFLMEILAQQFAHAKRHQRPLSVVMLDIDHFKQVNDTFLHATGDEVLKIVAQLLRASTRDSNCIARSGGEEFVIVLAEATLQHAHQYAERVRVVIEQYAWHTLHPDLHVTISAGVVTYTTHATYEALLHTADTQLYHAKHTGRNRVVAALLEPALPPEPPPQ